MAITRIKADTALSGTIPATNISSASLANVSTGTSWQAVKTTSFTAESGKGYFVDTTSGAITITMPTSPSAGDYVVLKDYARTWESNNVTTASALVDGVSDISITFNTTGQTVTLVYMDGTKGWSLTNEDTTTGLGAQFVTATGGTVTESGDYKIHTFTGDGCFVVSCGGSPAGSISVDYLVIAGGGGGGTDRGGGGGAGGYRESSGTASGCYTASPLGACVSALPVSATTYPITVGGGGSGGTQPGPTAPSGVNGSNSIFSTITSAGGGGGKNSNTGTAFPGGSGGGGSGSGCGPGGSGNTPTVSPPQGNPGGQSQDGSPLAKGSGGGGAGAAGESAVGKSYAPVGGDGVASSINGTSTTRAGGGGSTAKEPGQGGSGGSGGGGDGSVGGTNPGTTNTGGGGGASCTSTGGAGGSGIVVIRYKFQ